VAFVERKLGSLEVPSVATEQPSANQQKPKKPKKPKAPRAVGRPAPLVALHERYGLVYDPKAELDPIVADERKALNELYRERAGRDLTDADDLREALERVNLLQQAGARKRAKSMLELRRRNKGDIGDAYASALDALDAVGKTRVVQGFKEPFYEAPVVKAADKALGNLVDPLITASGVGIARGVAKGAQALDEATEAERPERGEVGVRGFRAQERTASGPLDAVRASWRAVGEERPERGEVGVRGFRAQTREVDSPGRAIGRLAGGVAEGIANAPSIIPNVAGLRIGATPTGRVYAPTSGARTLSDLQSSYLDMAENPNKYVDVKAPNMSLPQNASPGLQAGYQTIVNGLNAPQAQTAYEQNAQSPLSAFEDSFLKGLAAEAKWDTDNWDTLTPGEKIFRAYTDNSYWTTTLRSAVRAVGETGSAVAGVKALVGAIASAPSDDAEQLRLVADAMLEPYAYAKQVAERDGLSAGLAVAFRDDPVLFALSVNTALRVAGRAGGVAARAGLAGSRAQSFAEVGRPVTATRPGGDITEYRETPIPRPQIGPVGATEAAQLGRRGIDEVVRRQAEAERMPEIEEARAAGRVTPEGVAYTADEVQVSPSVLVGYTGPNLLSPAGLAVRSWVASRSKTYADRVSGKAAKRYTRRQANVADGVAVAIEQVLSEALGRVPTAIQRERAAFELTWAREDLNYAIVDGKFVVKPGAKVTPETIVSYFRGQAAARQREMDALPTNKGKKALAADRDRYLSQAIEWERIAAVRLDPDTIVRLREVARDLGRRNDELIAAALGVGLNEAKRANYIRLLVIDPKFERAARELRAERNYGVLSPKRFIRSQERVARLSRRIAEKSSERGFGQMSRPKSRARFTELVDDLIGELRNAERLASELGEGELAGVYRDLRSRLVLARSGAPERAVVLAQQLEDVERLRVRAEDLPEEARPAYAEASRLGRERREAEVVAGRAAEQAAVRLEEAGLQRSDARVVRLAEEAVEKARRNYELDRDSTMLSPERKAQSAAVLAEAEARLERVRAANVAQREAVATSRTAQELARGQQSSLREAQRMVLREQPVLDTDQVRAAVSVNGDVGAVRIRTKDDFTFYTIDRARGEVLDEFIARVEAVDNNAILHLVQRGNITDLSQKAIVVGDRTIDLGPGGRIRGGRLKPSRGDLFALGGEATNNMWRNLMFDTAELIAAEGWRIKINELIALTSLRVKLSDDVVSVARERATRRAEDGEDFNVAMEEEVGRALKNPSAQSTFELNLLDFKIMNPMSPSALKPSERTFTGLVPENIDEGSVAGLLWREVDQRTIDPDAPGEYFLVPRSVYDGIQASLRDEAFRFRPPDKGNVIGRALSLYNLDRATRAWRTLTLNVLPRTAFYNFTGSAILALQAGAGPRSFFYAWRALHGRADKDGNQYPVPLELQQRYYAGLTFQVGKDPRLAKYPKPVQIAAAWGAGYMNWLRKLNGMSEDFGRLAVWYSKAYPEAIRASAEGRRVMANAQRLNREAMELLDDMAADAPEWRAKNSAWIQKSYDFLGDLHRGGQFASRLRIAVPFWQWYAHMLKLTFFTMPLKYPGRAMFLQMLGQIGQEYQETHGVMVPYGEDLVPLWSFTTDVGGEPQWVTKAVSTSQWYPQGTPAELGGREGFAATGRFLRGATNPGITNGFLIGLAVSQAMFGEPVLEYSDYSALKSARNEVGNEIKGFDGDWVRFVANRLGQMMPLSPTVMSMAGRAPTSTLWDLQDKPERGPALERKRADLLAVLDDPWSFRPLMFLAKATFGLNLMEIPGIGPVERARIRRLADSQQRELQIEQRNIMRAILESLDDSGVTTSSPSRFDGE